jgi:hypothetical protein
MLGAFRHGKVACLSQAGLPQKEEFTLALQAGKPDFFVASTLSIR